MIIVRIHRDRELQVRTGLQNNDAILVAVEDSGSRFDPKRLGSLFDAVFTTKSHGIGLGLAICRMIVERHGGPHSGLRREHWSAVPICSADQVFRCGARKLTDQTSGRSGHRRFCANRKHLHLDTGRLHQR